MTTDHLLTLLIGISVGHVVTLSAVTLFYTLLAGGGDDDDEDLI